MILEGNIFHGGCCAKNKKDFFILKVYGSNLIRTIKKVIRIFFLLYFNSGFSYSFDCFLTTGSDYKENDGMKGGACKGEVYKEIGLLKMGGR